MNKELYQKKLATAQSLIEKEQFIEAEKHLVEVIQIDSNDVNVWVLLADVLSAQQYYVDSYNIIQKIRLFDPRSNWIEPTLSALKSSFTASKASKYNLKELLNIPAVSVTAAMIIKNDKENVKRWYDSLKKAVDEIVIIDTGSTDGTREIISNLPNVKVKDFAWCDDFAAARNSGLPLITGEWVIWLDSDEYLDAQEVELDSIRFLAGYYKKEATFPILKLEIVDTHKDVLTSSFDSPRMFSMQAGYTFEGRIHEQIISNTIEDVYARNSGIKVYHDGYSDEVFQKKNKSQRNIQLLKLSIKENPEDMASLSLLGREYKLQKDFSNALKYLEQAEQLMLEKNNYNIILDTYQHLAEIYAATGQVEKLDATINKMLNIEPNFPNAIYMKNLRVMEESVGKMMHALKEIEGIGDSFDKYRGNISADQEIFVWKADYLKAGILRHLGHLKEAESIYRKLDSQHEFLNCSQQLAFIDMQRKALNN